MLSRFHRIPERNGQTDRQTEGQTDRSISRVSVLTRNKNKSVSVKFRSEKEEKEKKRKMEEKR